MSGDREAASEQSSSVYKGAGYNELYPSGHEPEKYITLSPKRELSTHSLAKEEEEYEEDRETVGDEDEEGVTRATKERSTRRWSVKRSVMVLGLSSFLLYGR